MKVTRTFSLALLIVIALFLGSCSGGGGTTTQTFVVTVKGLLADSSTHSAVPDAAITLGSEPAVASGSDGWFTVPDMQAGTNLDFQAVHPAYDTVQGLLSLDTTSKTWTLVIAGTPQSQGQLIEESPGHLAFPASGQIGAMVVDMTATSGDGGGDMPPNPPF